jgi:hypothetical protein
VKPQHHFTFFIFVIFSGILLFFSSELLLPDAFTRVIFRSPQIDTIGHFIGFFVLTWFLTSIIKLSLLTTLFALYFYSACSELGQYYLGFRNGEFSDFFADVGGISLYILLKFTYLRYKHFTLKRMKNNNTDK